MQVEIYISNISEDVWSFIRTMHDKAKAQEILENTYLADRDLLTLPAGSRNILILPMNIDPDFLNYYKTLFNNPDVEVWTPESHSGEICKDILRDKSLLSRLIELSKGATFVMKSYSTTFQFLDLISYLRDHGITVDTPESPDISDSWTVDYFGSKSGIRQVSDQHGSWDKPWMGKGYILDGIYDVASLAANMYCKNGAVVLKTHKAHAGAGVKIFHPNELPSDFNTCYKTLINLLKQENYWKLFPVIVESYIQADATVGGGNPNCEYIIDKEGNLKLLFYCGMRVDQNGVFKGIEIHRDLLPQDVTDKLSEYGKILGKTYYTAGYRGYFDVDCVYTKKKELLITESNVRRTGGSHLYHIAMRLIGPDFMNQAFILSNNTYPLDKTKDYSFKKVLDVLKPILFSHETKEGLVLASISGLKYHSLGYVIIGKDKQSAYETEEKMEQLLRKL